MTNDSPRSVWCKSCRTCMKNPRPMQHNVLRTDCIILTTISYPGMPCSPLNNAAATNLTSGCLARGSEFLAYAASMQKEEYATEENKGGEKERRLVVVHFALDVSNGPERPAHWTLSISPRIPHCIHSTASLTHNHAVSCSPLHHPACILFHCIFLRLSLSIDLPAGLPPRTVLHFRIILYSMHV